MDPLSIIAGVSGVAQAGASLAGAIFTMIEATRNAPTEVVDIGRGISDLAIIMGELRRVLKEGKDIFRRKLLRQVNSSMKRIARTHGEIEGLLGVDSGFKRVKWAFRRSKSMQLLYKIESYKNGISLILQTMILACHLSRQRSKKDSQERSDDGNDKGDPSLVRQHAENLIQVSYHSLRRLVSREDEMNQRREDDDNDDKGASTDGTPEGQVQLWKAERGDTARWLYDLVFSAAVEARRIDSSRNSDPAEEHESAQAGIDSTDASNELILGGDAEVNQVQLIMEQPIPATSVVNELLSEWTTLTKDEINTVKKSRSGADHREATEENQQEETPDIRFEDCVGRKFRFPWRLAKTFKGVEKLIKEAFLHVDVIGPHVQEGYYDLLHSTGDVILPTVWEDLVKPGDAITMHMWPMDKAPTPGVRPGPPPPGWSTAHRRAGEPRERDSKSTSAPGPSMPAPTPKDAGIPAPAGGSGFSRGGTRLRGGAGMGRARDIPVRSSSGAESPTRTPTAPGILAFLSPPDRKRSKS